MRFISGLLLVVVFVSQLFSQQFGMRGEQRKRLEEFKKIKLIEALEMNEEEAARFFPIYREHQDRVQRLQSERDKLIDQLDRLSKSEEKFKVDKFEELIQKLNDVEQQLIQNRIEFHNQLKVILPPFKVARFYVFERNFIRELNKLLMRRHRNIE